MLHDGLAEPVDARVVADRVVHRIDHDNLKVFVRRILVDPVRVEHAQSSALPSDTLFCDAAQVTVELQGSHTLVHRLSVNLSLLHRALARASAHANPVDDVALLGLVSHLTSLVGTGGCVHAPDAWQLAVLPASDALEVPEGITLLLAPDFGHVLVGSHGADLW